MMTNDEMRTILERGLGIPIKESDAAWILSVVEEKLRNEKVDVVWYWVCQNCEQKNGKEYNVCWRCNHSRR